MKPRRSNNDYLRDKTRTHRRAIAFDLDTNYLKELFGRNYTKAYRDIQKIMLDAGFSNKEHSVYETAFLCSNYKVACTLNTLLTKHPYLNKAIKDIRVNDIDDRVHVFNSLLDKNDKSLEKFENTLMINNNEKDISEDYF